VTIALILVAALCAAAGAWAVAAERRAARLQALLEAERQSSVDKLAAVERVRDTFKDTFAALSADALATNNQRFLELAREKLGELQIAAATDLDGRQRAINELVQPLRESLGKVDSKLQEIDRERAASHACLAEQLRSLSAAQVALQSETGRLARALRSPNIRGQWGELQLRRVLEAAGMLEGSHFELKESVNGDNGRLTPDVIVKLPGGRNVVVDAKVPLSAFLDAGECEEETARDAKLKDHARQVKDHIVRLANKTYWAHFQPTPDIVVMFVPGESLLSAALQHDNALLEFSM
jgi:DNA recombination protein RmuC